MAEPGVEVQFGANAAGLRAGIQEVLNLLDGGFAGITEKAAAFTSKLIGITIAVTVLEKLGEAFVGLVEHTVEFNEKVEFTAIKLGTTTEAAQNLINALGVVGLSTEDYTGALFKLERQVATNEDRLRRLGVVTRDQNGNLVDSQTLMKNAIAALNEYKAGTDRNAAALEIFGRSAEQVYRLQKLNNEAMATGAEITAKYGAVTQENVENSEHLERAWNTLKLTFQAWVTSVGNAIIPSLTSIIERITTLTPLLDALGAVIKLLIGLVDTLFTGLAQAFDLFWGTIQITIAGIEGLANVLNAILSGDLTAIKAEMSKAAVNIEGVWTETFSTIAENGQAWKDRMLNLLGLETKTPQTTPGGPGNKGFVDPGQSAAAEKAFQEWLTKLIEREKKAADIQRAMATESINIEREKGLGRLAIEEDMLHRQRELGQISEAEEIQGLEALKNQEYQIELKALQDKINLAGQETKERAKLYTDIEKLTQKHNLEMQKLQTQEQLATINRWKSLLAPIQQTITQSVTGILQGTQTVLGAVRNLLTGLLSSFADFAAQWALNWILEQIFVQTSTSASSVTSSIGQIFNAAAVAAANAFASIAAIPYIGPALAPGAASAAYAATASFAAGVTPFEVGAWEIPSNMLAYLHKGEAVVPQSFAEGMRNNGGAGGGVHLHVHAVDADSVKKLFRNNGTALAAALRHQLRNFNPHLKPA